MSGLRTRTVLVAATLLIAGSALTGCSGGEPELKAAAAKQLQSGVLTVTTAAADGDFATAQSALANVQADVLAAAAAGDVTKERSQEIQAAIKLVSADLEAAIDAETPPPTEAPEPTEEPAPSEEPTTEPEPTEEPPAEPEPTEEPPAEPEPTVEPPVEPTAPEEPPATDETTETIPAP